MEQVTDVRKCSCGAITVHYENGSDSSMSEDLYKELYPEREPDGYYENCNYCVNHWGIDLCGCGSGEKVGECTNEYEECTTHQPAQLLGQKKKTMVWR